MLTNLHNAWTMGSALLRFLTSTYVDVDDFLGAIDRLDGPTDEQVMSDPRMCLVAERPMFQPLPSVEVLLTCDEGTVGRTLGEMMAEQGFDHIQREVDDTPGGRVRAWAEQTHDLWHVVTGFGTHLPGELGLQAFYLAQIGALPAQLVLAAMLLRTLNDDRQRVEAFMDAVAFGWQQGRAARSLTEVDWHAELGTQVHELRTRLGLTPATGALAEGRYEEDRAAYAA